MKTEILKETLNSLNEEGEQQSPVINKDNSKETFQEVVLKFVDAIYDMERCTRELGEVLKKEGYKDTAEDVFSVAKIPVDNMMSLVYDTLQVLDREEGTDYSKYLE